MAKVLIEIDDGVLMGALAESQDQQLILDKYVEQVLRRAQAEETGTPLAPVDLGNVIETACQKAQALTQGERFHLTDLIGEELWQTIDTGERRAMGKTFRARMEQSEPKIADHIGRTSANLAIYKRA
ncbi:DUF1413 domain-containing protein [Corallococcus exiguus]|uniref:DUF1413 domain-containing protein n=1 Tax=Corallococcus exiguus TaxID=83462 RepID=UPI001494C880|nr:DUF1413 domain-containing protein [Corallococcus exiguus]NPC69522.1 DUF1413 domain-containing protein [Corallococcus exiguus]